MEKNADQSPQHSTRRIPDHVPPELVVDFDGYRPMNGASFYHEPYAELHGKVPDVFWSPYNGGHWVLTRREHLAEAFADYARFTSYLGSGLIDQSQKMTVAARATTEKKAFGHRS